jgi:hypothetical protein
MGNGKWKWKVRAFSIPYFPFPILEPLGIRDRKVTDAIDVPLELVARLHQRPAVGEQSARRALDADPAIQGQAAA